MSGKPNPERVNQFIQILNEMTDANLDIRNTLKDIETLNARLTKARMTYGTKYTELFELMQNMDVYSSANTGYRERMAWFLVELNTTLQLKNQDKGGDI